MSDGSKIEWTDATWNPITGCEIATPGCINCYAMRLAGTRLRNHPSRKGLTEIVKGKPVWNGEVRFNEQWLDQPLRWQRPRRVFVCAHGDLFYEKVPDEWIDKVFAVMALCPQHTFQVLTKRAARMKIYISDPQTPHRVARAMDEIQATQTLGPEEIRPIEDYPGYYVSSHGFVYSERRGKRRKLKPDVGEQGHLRVPLYYGDKAYDRVLVHRLVLETFVGPPPSSIAQGRHRDQNPENNAVTNLRWGDQEQNWDDSKRHGSHRRYSKLTTEQAAEIKQRFAQGETAAALGRAFDISDTQARNIGTGKQWNVAIPIEWPLPQIWLGVSCERQQEADERIPHLLATPAAIRFVSAEPLLGPITLDRISTPGNGLGWFDAFASPDHCLDWVIVGGESGPRARPFNIEWAESIIKQCRSADIAVFMKQMAGKAPIPSNLMVREFPN